jgi:ATP-binding cassette subfamily F protein 3
LSDQGQVRSFDGDLNDYYQYMLGQKKKERQEKQDKQEDQKNQPKLERVSDNPTANQALESTPESAKNKKETRQQRAQVQAKLRPLQDKVNKLEKEITRLQAQKKLFDLRLQDEAFYQDKVQLNEVLAAQQQLQTEIDAKELIWIELVEELERLTG